MRENFLNLIRNTFKEWSEDKAPRLAAALAYYTVFAIPPLLVILLGIASLFLNQQEVQDALLGEIGGLLTPEAARAIGGMIEGAKTDQAGGLAAAVGVGILLLGASGIFLQLQDALNTVWEVRAKPGLGIMALLKKRFFSFLMVLAVGFLLLVSLVLSTALTALGEWIQSWLPGSNWVFQSVNFLLPFLAITLLFALMFRYMPDAEIAWRDVWPGAAITSLLFNLGKTLIGLYLARSNLAHTYGAAASVVLIFVWVYYTAQILLLGAEFTKVYAEQLGAGIRPEPHAEMVKEQERLQQGMQVKEST
jgi:membrane protein